MKPSRFSSFRDKMKNLSGSLQSKKNSPSKQTDTPSESLLQDSNEQEEKKDQPQLSEAEQKKSKKQSKPKKSGASKETISKGKLLKLKIQLNLLETKHVDIQIEDTSQLSSLFQQIYDATKIPDNWKPKWFTLNGKKVYTEHYVERVEVTNSQSSFTPGKAMININSPFIIFYNNFYKSIQPNYKQRMKVSVSKEGLNVGGCLVQFRRNLKVPDDRDPASFPSYGNIECKKISEVGDSCPQEWKKQGGVFLHLHSQEACSIYIDSCREVSVQIEVGKGVNGVTGKSISERGKSGYGQFLVCPPERNVHKLFLSNGKQSTQVVLPPDSSSLQLQFHVYPKLREDAVISKDPSDFTSHYDLFSSPSKAGLKEGGVVYLHVCSPPPSLNEIKSATLRSYGISESSKLCVEGIYMGRTKIFVQIGAKKVAILVDDSFRIKQVKKIIEYLEDIPSEHQQLYFNNTQLVDTQSIEYYKIKKEDLLHLKHSKALSKVTRDAQRAARVFVYIVNDKLYSELTGSAPSDSPIGPKEYARASLPWIAPSAQQRQSSSDNSDSSDDSEKETAKKPKPTPILSKPPEPKLSKPPEPKLSKAEPKLSKPPDKPLPKPATDTVPKRRQIEEDSDIEEIPSIEDTAKAVDSESSQSDKDQHKASPKTEKEPEFPVIERQKPMDDEIEEVPLEESKEEAPKKQEPESKGSLSAAEEVSKAATPEVEKIETVAPKQTFKLLPSLPKRASPKKTVPPTLLRRQQRTSLAKPQPVEEDNTTSKTLVKEQDTSSVDAKPVKNEEKNDKKEEKEKKSDSSSSSEEEEGDSSEEGDDEEGSEDEEPPAPVKAPPGVTVITIDTRALVKKSGGIDWPDIKGGSQWIGEIMGEEPTPFKLTVGIRVGKTIKGSIVYPTLDDAKTKIRGNVKPDVIEFIEDEVVNGEVKVPRVYRATVAGHILDGKMTTADKNECVFKLGREMSVAAEASPSKPLSVPPKMPLKKLEPPKREEFPPLKRVESSPPSDESPSPKREDSPPPKKKDSSPDNSDDDDDRNEGDDIPSIPALGEQSTKQSKTEELDDAALDNAVDEALEEILAEEHL